MDRKLAIGDNHQNNEVGEEFVCVVLPFRCPIQPHIIQLEKDERKHIRERLPASRVALQDRIAIAQNTRNLL